MEQQQRTAHRKRRGKQPNNLGQDQPARLHFVAALEHHVCGALNDLGWRDLPAERVCKPIKGIEEELSAVVGRKVNLNTLAFKESTPQIPWREIIGMQNRLVQGYASVDHDIVRDVVSRDLAGGIEALELLLVD